MPPSADIQDLSSHARTRLAPSKKKGLTRQEKLALYKRFLKTEEHRIYLLHKSGAAGLRVAGRRSDLIDVIVRNLYEDGLEDAEREGDTSKAPPLAILAAGGYGRGRLNPHSDIDLHFITPKGGAKLPAAQKKLVESVLYMLYDCGFKVGHAVRSVRETIQQANQDTKTKSAIIEARLICGNEELFDTLLEEFQKKCIARHEKEYLTTRLEDLRSRHAKWANTVFLQEPNVKESCGGLRDYQNLIWVAFVKTGSTRLADLHERKMMTVSAYRELRKGYDFLMRVRNELHYIQKRSGDILTLRLQGIVARNFQYPQRGVLRKTEAFMRDYYEHTRNVLLRSSELLDEFYLEQTAEAGGLSGLLGKANKPDHSIDGFVVKQDRLYADPKLRFADDPNQILQLFRHAQLRKLRLAPELVQKIQRHYKQINRTFRYSKTNRETFEAILSRKGEVAPALRKMHRAGVLGRYMPEFGALTNLVQHEFFHRYTADEHTLRCIEELDGLATDESPKAGVFRKQFLKLEDPFVIYLSLLLHDTGRAFNTDAHDQASAELAGKVCRRLGLDIRRRRLVLFLVDHHLTFWRTATTKNLEDPVTISEFASIIRDRTRLDYLFLHTYADSRGTNDEAWTDWKASLIRQLYFTTVEYIEDHESFLKKYETDKAVLFEQVEAELPAVFDAAIREHFECSPKRYFRTQSPEKICAHIKLIEEHKKTDAVIPTFNWKPQPEMGWTTLSTASFNQKALLSCVSGALAAEQINILSADLFIRTDGIVIDFFRVCTSKLAPVTAQRVIKKVEKNIADALAGSPPDFDALIASVRNRDRKETPDFQIPQRVYIDQHSRTDATTVELQVQDRIGLLYDIFRTLNELDIEVTNARISTTCGAAIDTIYVVDSKGERLSNEEEINALQLALEMALDIAAVKP